MSTVTVLGAGMMGSALCVPMADAGHEVRLVGTHLDAAIVAALQRGEPHPGLKGATLPEGVRPLPFEALDEALDGADRVALGVSSAGIEWAIAQLLPRLADGVPVFMITKGLRMRGGALATLVDVVAEGVPQAGPVGAIGGPCIAGELARRVPTCVMATSHDRAFAEALAEELSTAYYHPVPSTDVVGVEVCAALKNAFAMGVALGAGMHAAKGGDGGSVAMHNLESAVFAQAVLEMQAVVARLGGEVSTAAGLAGAGDLDVTNNGGRTGRFGRWLGRGVGLEEAVRRMEGATLECLEILSVMREAVAAWGDEAPELPLLEHLAAIALDDAPVDLPLRRFFR